MVLKKRKSKRHAGSRSSPHPLSPSEEEGKAEVEDCKVRMGDRRSPWSHQKE
jgi:hypothetical protein